MAKILIVDHEMDSLATTKAWFERAKTPHEVTDLANLPAALEALQKDHFDLVITGTYLSGSEGGYEVAAAAKAAKTPVIAFTVTPEYTRRAEFAAVCDKFSLSGLEMKVNGILAAAQSQGRA